MKNVFIAKSPAKINIGLRVLSKRPDGYHNIETIFYPIKLYDTVTVHMKKLNNSDESKISVRVAEDSRKPLLKINDENNICYNAVKYFIDDFDIKGKYEVKIRIKKKIPIGAGLGGGSSNAATVLKILAKYFSVRKNLLSIALKLGSDVPFFLMSKPAYATSRGEKLKLLKTFRVRYKILIVNPGIHASTAWGYRQLRISDFQMRNENSLSKIKDITLRNLEKASNDFEKVVFKRYPAIQKIKETMYETGAVFSSMSGSGSTVYGFYNKKAELNSAQKLYKQKNYRVFTV